MIVVSLLWYDEWWLWYDLSGRDSTQVKCQASWWLQSTVPSHLAISSAAKIINDSSPPPPSSLFWSSTTSSPAAWSIAHRYHLSEHRDWWRRTPESKWLKWEGSECSWYGIIVNHLGTASLSTIVNHRPENLVANFLWNVCCSCFYHLWHLSYLLSFLCFTVLI